MKTPTNNRPLKIRVEQTTFNVTEVSPILGSIRISGYADSPSKSVGFDASRLLAKHLCRRDIGAVCLAESDAANPYIPFSFDVPREFIGMRKEDDAEFISRVMRELRKAVRHFAA